MHSFRNIHSPSGSFELPQGKYLADGRGSTVELQLLGADGAYSSVVKLDPDKTSAALDLAT